MLYVIFNIMDLMTQFINFYSVKATFFLKMIIHKED